MTNDPATPLPPDVVDELLSAELDGELDAAAHDLGLEAETVRARLASTPGIDARRAALTRARDVIAEVPALDDATTARLVAAALPHAPVDELTARRTARRGRVLGIASAAAVVALVLVAVAVGTTGRDDDKSVVASSPQAESRDDAAATGGANALVQDLGEVSDPAVLRDRVNGGLLQVSEGTEMFGYDRSAGLTSDGTGESAAKESADAAAPPAETQPAAGLALPRTSPVTLSDDCVAAQANAFAVTTPPSFTAAATFHGQPAVVVVYTLPTGRQVLVVSPDGCTLLLAQLLT